ncbi:MAG: hypothetical protein QF702_00985 [Prochlorococcaceae cyanobacterium ETNP2_MAG_10]|nr:hypothetical protein [Prochlorococcaceae cyanobacterium ETNP2_MAG_10]
MICIDRIDPHKTFPGIQPKMCDLLVWSGGVVRVGARVVNGGGL